VAGTFLVNSESRIRLAVAGKIGSHEAHNPAEHAHGEQPHEGHGQGEQSAAEPASGIDIVCGMSVLTAQAKSAGLTSVYQGKTYIFCSRQCKEQFDKEPARYLDKAGGDGHSAHTHGMREAHGSSGHGDG
jgi:YHS domain-containing protein